MKKFQLLTSAGEVIGVYSTKQDALSDAFILMIIDEVYSSLEIITVVIPDS